MVTPHYIIKCRRIQNTNYISTTHLTRYNIVVVYLYHRCDGIIFMYKYITVYVHR